MSRTTNKEIMVVIGQLARMDLRAQTAVAEWLNAVVEVERAKSKATKAVSHEEGH